MTEENLRNEIESCLGPSKWSELARELAKDTIIIVAPEHDLVEVGLSIAKDDSETIKDLMKTGGISKPSEEILKTWGEENPELTCTIVKPFILVQKK